MALLEIVLLTIVVLEPAVGEAPFEFPKVGVFVEVALNSTYPDALDPVEGNVAAVQLKSILLGELAFAERLDA